MAAAEEDPDSLTLHEVEDTLREMDAADWKRAERLASSLVGGVHEFTPEDLLFETCTKLMSGMRRFPRNQHPLVVLFNLAIPVGRQEQRLDRIQKLIPSRAGDLPVPRQMFVVAENLLHEHQAG